MLEPGESLLLYSDGLVEAHDPGGEMFGFPRLRELMGRATASTSPVDGLLGRARPLHGPGLGAGGRHHARRARTCAAARRLREDGNGTVLAAFELASIPGNEREAMERVARPRWRGLDIAGAHPRTAADRRLRSRDERDRARERGFGRAAGGVQVLADPERAARADLGSGRRPADRAERERPDLEAKLEGEQKPRGWGLFLIEHMADGMDSWTEGERHTVELTFRLRGDKDADESL